MCLQSQQDDSVVSSGKREHHISWKPPHNGKVHTNNIPTVPLAHSRFVFSAITVICPWEAYLELHEPAQCHLTFLALNIFQRELKWQIQ